MFKRYLISPLQALHLIYLALNFELTMFYQLNGLQKIFRPQSFRDFFEEIRHMEQLAQNTAWPNNIAFYT